MRYTLWSRGRLVGHTDLDVHTVTSTMRQGFIEPTDEGRTLLADATGVWRTMAEVKRAARARGGPGESDSELFMAAVQRREDLDFELHDAQGAQFECDFMRVTDLFDMENGIVDEMCDTEEEQEAEFQIRLSGMSEEDRGKALAERADSEAEIEEFVRDMMDEREERVQAGWPPLAPEDPRFDTMQYLLQVHMRAPAWEELEF
jgi:hypothetical protein